MTRHFQLAPLYLYLDLCFDFHANVIKTTPSLLYIYICRESVLMMFLFNLLLVILYIDELLVREFQLLVLNLISLTLLFLCSLLQ